MGKKVSNRDDKIITVAIPMKPETHGPMSMPDQFMQECLEAALKKFNNKYPDYKLNISNLGEAVIRHSDTTASRSLAAENMIGTHLFMIDSDQAIDENALINLFEADKDIVIGTSVRKKPPYDPLFGWLDKSSMLHWAIWGYDFDGIDIIKDRLVPVDVAGLNAVLIKRHVFEIMDPEIYGPWFCRIQVPLRPETFYSHDSSFLLRAKAAGIQTYVHLGVRNAHDTRDGWLWFEAHEHKLKDPYFRYYHSQEIEKYGLIPRAKQREMEIKLDLKDEKKVA